MTTKKPAVPEAERLQPFDSVRITYAPGNVVPYRHAWVVADDGGPKVLVRWRTQDGPRVARNVVLYHGHEVEQRIPRERLVKLP